MPTKTKSTAPAAPVAAQLPTKSALVLKLLARAKGATIAEMEGPTGWQPHSTRAFLSGLRKKGLTIARETRKTGETAYRAVTASTEAANDSALSTVAPTTEVAVDGDSAVDPIIDQASADGEVAIAAEATA